MNDLQPLMTLLAQAERERDDARAHEQRHAAAHRKAQAQVDQLLEYRRDYEARWGEHFGRQSKIELLRCYQGFIERLSQAVEQQRLAAEHAGRQAAAAAAALQVNELRVASVRKLIARRVAEQQVNEDRRQQKQTDEFASRAAWQRLSNFGSLSAR